MSMYMSKLLANGPSSGASSTANGEIMDARVHETSGQRDMPYMNIPSDGMDEDEVIGHKEFPLEDNIGIIEVNLPTATPQIPRTTKVREKVQRSRGSGKIVAHGHIECSGAELEVEKGWIQMLLQGIMKGYEDEPVPYFY